VAPGDCAVFEDAEAGIEAAVAAGMLAIGVGNPAILKQADLVVPGLFGLSIDQLRIEANKKNNAVTTP
jgi:beta-phosphoglucomutase